MYVCTWVRMYAVVSAVATEHCEGLSLYVIK